MGFLDDDGGLLIGGLAAGGQGFIKGMQDAEDRRYKRMEFEAKRKAEDWDKEKKALEAQQEKTKRGFDQAGKLRDDWLKNQTTKNSQTMKESYDKILSASPTAAGDMSLVFGYMKLLDPGSTVRESEYANASNTTGVAGKAYQWWNKVKDGQILTPQQRAQFKREAAQAVAAQQKSQGALDSQFRGLADTYGINQGEVVLRIFEDPQTGEQKVVPVPKQQAPQIQGAAEPGLVAPKKGLIKKAVKAAPAKGPTKIDDIDNMSQEELERYLHGG